MRFFRLVEALFFFVGIFERIAMLFVFSCVCVIQFNSCSIGSKPVKY